MVISAVLSEFVARKVMKRHNTIGDLSAVVTGLILAFGGDEGTAETVGGCIMAAASVVAYTIGEGLADGAALTNKKEDE